MPTNQEWLNQLATESPDKLKAWFDAEHNDNLAAEKVVSCDAANSNDGNAHLKASEDLSDGFTDSREKLETDLRSLTVSWRDYDGNYMRTYSSVAYAQIKELIERQAAITEQECAWRWQHIAEDRDRAECRNDELRTSYDKLKRERDNLAADLLACNREREQLRKHLGIALDHAHDICSLVDIDGNVLDVGD